MPDMHDSLHLISMAYVHIVVLFMSLFLAALHSTHGYAPHVGPVTYPLRFHLASLSDINCIPHHLKSTSALSPLPTLHHFRRLLFISFIFTPGDYGLLQLHRSSPSPSLFPSLSRPSDGFSVPIYIYDSHASKYIRVA
jgi:hypothetical protein